MIYRARFLFSILLAASLFDSASAGFPQQCLKIPFYSSFQGERWHLPESAKIDILPSGIERITLKSGENPNEAAVLTLNLKDKEPFYIVSEAEAIISKSGNKSYEGLKFQLSYKLGKKTFWKDATHNNNEKIFKKKKLSIFVDLPPEAENPTLLLGFQNAFGKASFENLRIMKRDTFVQVDENFKCQYSDKVKNTPPLRGFMSPTKVSESDIEGIAAMGGNLIRIQLNRNWKAENSNMDISDFALWLGEKIAEVKSVSKLAEKLGVKIILDMHSPAGGRSENYEMRMFHEKKYSEAFVDIWRAIARSLKGNRAIFAYGLINEPVQNFPAESENWHELQFKAAKAIREVDPDIPIVVSAPDWDSPEGFSRMRPIPLRDIIYEVHMYVPHSYTHQKVHDKNDPEFSYPGEIQGTFYDSKKLEEILKSVSDFQKKYGARIYVGEFSAIRWAPNAHLYISDCIGIFEKNGWDWSYHAFREWHGWDLDMGETMGDNEPSKQISPRKKVILKAFEKNSPKSKGF